MKILFFGFVLLLIQVNVPNQDPYVCLPCGYSCDDQEHTSPGTCGACGMALVKKSTIQFTTIDLKDFCNRLAANPNAILIDVRSPAEFAGTIKDRPSFGHFKRAININVEELEMRVGELEKYKNKEVLVYCSQSHRSPRASYLLGTHGFKNVKNLVGGVSTFREQNAECLKKEFVFHAQ
jgi:rhodanese-related sulfurtransferase